MTLAKSSPSFKSPHSNTPRDYELTYGRIDIANLLRFLEISFLHFFDGSFARVVPTRVRTH
jgi:hypothetical protein